MPVTGWHCPGVNYAPAPFKELNGMYVQKIEVFLKIGHFWNK
jgi:hypothetical protein